MGTNYGNLGSLGDLFQQTGMEQPCRTRGCKNMVSISTAQGMLGRAQGGKGHGDGGKMCDSCWAYFKTLEDKQVPCSKPGCKNTWTWNRYQQLEAHVKGHDTPPRGLCNECRSQEREKQDQQIPCRTRGCKNTWTWTRRMQMESKDGRPPHRLCDSCFSIWSTLQDRQLPCRVKGCKNEILWTRTSQLEWLRDGKKLENPPRRMCPSCFEKFNLLKPIEVPCRVNGCSHTWIWTPFDQLEAAVNLPVPEHGKKAAGKKTASLEAEKEKAPGAPAAEASAPAAEASAPAAEATAPTAETLPAATPAPVVETSAPAASVETASPAIAAPAPESAPVEDNNPMHLTPPHRMCRECIGFFEKAKDQEQPCMNRGCEGKWVWTRAMQLAGHVRGHEQPPRRMCEKCQKELKALKPIQEPCQEADCHGTWTYTPEEQLKDRLLNRPPQGRHCPACEAFLKEHQPQELTCEKCGEKFPWSVREQLLTSLGTFQKPVCCAKCNTEDLAAQPPAPSVIIPAAQTAFKVKMPGAGPWYDSAVTRDWPVGMTNQVIARMEAAEKRMVFLGDEQVAGEAETPSLPALLEACLNSQSGKADGVCVLNAGIPGSTTALSLARVGRDVAPFAPRVVFFSCALADALKGREEEQGAMIARLTQETEALIRQLKSLESAPLVVCWLPNPIFPQVSGNFAWRENLDPDVQLVNRYDSILRNLLAVCQRNEVAVANGKAIFDMQGQQTAKESMATWCRPNAEGCKAHLRALLEAMK